eukprot:TRINITY_DN58020_c0_g1_i1.p2 TRINITY_DN58020_c0_g1~~TRINITY_DN58020_c0_g1_i1.p2  ORF type:complete len:126 (-),score=0.85 TRINITY_DN58020_c0_g1_i1:239-616(-)
MMLIVAVVVMVMMCLDSMLDDYYTFTALHKESITSNLIDTLQKLNFVIQQGKDIAIIVSKEWINRHQNELDETFVMRRRFLSTGSGRKLQPQTFITTAFNQRHSQYSTPSTLINRQIGRKIVYAN